MANELFDLINDAPFGFVGAGAQLNIMNKTLKKYSLLIPLEQISSPSGSVETIEHKPTTARTAGLIRGIQNVESKDMQFLWCRQNLDRLNEFLGTNNQYLISLSDGTGFKFEGEFTYKLDDTDVSNKTTGTITFIPSSCDSSYISDISDIFANTCLATNMNVSKIALSTGHTSESITLKLSNANGTVTARSNNTNITATVSDKTVTINVTTPKDMTGIVYITTSATDEASWTYPVYVQVSA